jgi:hypothetical protein
MDKAAPYIARTPALEFVEDAGLPEGRVPWVNRERGLPREVKL